jgi:hypothetical protein
LNPYEKSTIMKITCETVVHGNRDFGPEFSNEIPNTETYLVECPPNCHEGSDKVGL